MSGKFHRRHPETRDLDLNHEPYEASTPGVGVTIQDSIQWDRESSSETPTFSTPEVYDELKAGTFILMDRVNQGGSGEIWSAKQSTLRRTVAVKKLRKSLYEEYRNKPERLADKERQFQVEALLTAQLDHPFILPIYELGKDDHGHPLIAMKLLEGDNWQDRITKDHEELDEFEFLQRHLPIFIDMAQALSFAHARGIVHRDLKPSQVMIGRYGEVVLMDWGLAIVVEQDTVENPLSDEVLELLPTKRTAVNPAGTPCLMAPEQVKETAEEIGIHTDTFLMGAILYYLLSGFTIHSGSTVADLLMKASACRVVPLHDRAPGRMIPGVLSDLAMKCLSKDPSDRPKSIRTIIHEIEVYLAGDSNRREALVLLQEARDKLERIGERGASGVAPVEHDAMKGRRRKVYPEERYSTFSDCLNLVDRATGLWPNNAQIPEIRRKVVHGYVRQAIQAGDLTLARAVLRRLESSSSIRTYEQTIQNIEARQERKENQRGYATAGIFLLLMLLIAGGVKYIYDQGRSEEAALEARFDAERMVSFMILNLNEDLKDVGQLSVLEKVANRALDYYEDLDDKDVDTMTRHNHAQALRILGDVKLDQGQLETARRFYEKAIRIREANPPEAGRNLNLANDFLALGETAKRLGNMNKAGEHFRHSLKLLNEISDGAVSRRDVAMTLSDTYGQLGNIQLAMNDHQKAEELFLDQLAIRQELVNSYPENLAYANSVATSHVQLGWSYLTLDDGEKALAALSEAVSIRKDIVSQDPKNLRFQLDLASALTEHGRGLRTYGNYSEALAIAEEAISIYRTIAANDPENLSWQGELALALLNYATLLAENESEEPQTLRIFQEAESVYTRLVSADPEDIRWGTQLGVLLRRKAAWYAKNGNAGEARETIGRAITIHRELFNNPKEQRLAGNVLVYTYNSASSIYLALGEPENAKRFAQKAVELAKRLKTAHPEIVFQDQMIEGSSTYLRLAEEAIDQSGLNPDPDQ